MNESYEAVIGLEIHIQPRTRSKMFCGCSASIFEAAPNTHTCPVCLGLPGALPVTNKEAVRHTLLLGTALGCSLASSLKFDRKHYFYPDLPKGYQISQYDEPLAFGGFLDVEGGNGGMVRIRRVHLEEDTAKLVHQGGDTLIDFNRSGMPLIELVTEPDLVSADHAYSFLKEIHQIVTHLGISEAKMEHGTMRLEPNISVRPVGQRELPAYKVEVKNINSFRFAKKAIAYEIERQSQLLDAGEHIVQETRGWDAKKGETVPQRVKEELDDYRYFPEPDLPRTTIIPELLQGIEERLADLPSMKAEAWRAHGVNEENIQVLLGNERAARYVQEAVDGGADAQETATLIINTPSLMDNGILPAELTRSMAEQKASQVSDEGAVTEIVQEVLANHPEEVQKYLAGKESVLQFLLGQVMAASKGTVSPQIAQEVLKKQLTQIDPSTV